MTATGLPGVHTGSPAPAPPAGRDGTPPDL